MNIFPAKKTVVIKLTTLGNFNKGTLEVVTEKEPEIGEVIEIGSGKSPVEGMKKGDTIAYRKYGESKFFVGTEQYLFISFVDVLGVIKKGKND